MAEQVAAADDAALQALWTAKDEADCQTWRAAKVKAWEAGEKIKEKHPERADLDGRARARVVERWVDALAGVGLGRPRRVAYVGRRDPRRLDRVLRADVDALVEGTVRALERPADASAFMPC